MTEDWHTSDFPELRPGPPWVMEEMIRSQADLPEQIAGVEGATAVHEAVSRALAGGDDVLVVGCGTSEHAAMAIASLLADALAGSPGRRRIQARQALDVAVDPPPAGLVLGVSHDGGTRATQLALERANEAGAVTAAITARGDSAVAAAAELLVVTPALDRSWCHTVAYTSAILAGAAIAYAGRGDDWVGAARGALADALGSDAARNAGRRLHPARRILTAGVGADLIAARELALKIEEGARIPATAHHLETLLHGHLAGCDAPETRLVLFAVDPGLTERQRRRLALAARAVEAIGLPTTGFVAAGLRDLMPPTAEVVELSGITADPESRLVSALLAAAAALQLATLGLVDSAGTNPDLIRREQAPYRAAAEIADGTADW